MLCQLELSILLLVLLLISAARGVPQNVTCDDQNECGLSTGGATIAYSSGVWKQGSTCTGCLLHPNLNNAYEQTWHDATLDFNDSDHRTIQVTFQGTAIYAYFIVPDNVAAFMPNVTLLTNMSVILDDELVGNVLHMPQGQSDFIYNFLGYSNSSLSNDTHMMTISANNQVSSSLILFDYLIYTTDSSLVDAQNSTAASSSTSTTFSSAIGTSTTFSTKSSTSPSIIYSTSPSITSTGSGPPGPTTTQAKDSFIAPIIGGVLGGLLFLGLAAIFIWRKQRVRETKLDQNSKRYSPSNIQPYLLRGSAPSNASYASYSRPLPPYVTYDPHAPMATSHVNRYQHKTNERVQEWAESSGGRILTDARATRD